MKKTVFSKSQLAGVVDDFAKIDRDLRDLKTVFACVAFQQDDKVLEVPFAALQEMPTGVQLEISVDQVKQAYVFRVILPPTTQTPEVVGK